MNHNDRLSNNTRAAQSSLSQDCKYGLCFVLVLSAIAAMTSIAPGSAFAQVRSARDPAPESLPEKPKVFPGTLVIPAASKINAVDLGKRAHANVRYIAPALAAPAEAPPFSGYGYETPSSLACVYHVVTPVAGCNPNTTVALPTGGSETIAIVDAYDDPEAPADLAYFSAQFGLPFSPEKFNVVYASGYEPPVDFNGGWELEESLDIEYAHAMAPKATIYLVEANSNLYTDLFAAVQVASNLIACRKTTTCPTGSTGKGEISMSWGGEEFASEVGYDSVMTTKNIVYLAAAGDSAGVSYPCASPNVVCVGGTSTARSTTTGSFLQEIAWSEAGGGLSFYESRPTYQAAISTLVGAARGVPDLSADSNPTTGVWVYDSFPMGEVYEGNWWIVGGTSVATPTLAGIVNAAGHFAASTSAELTTVYADRAVATDFNDITYGACGYYSGSFSVKGWDLCTGVGSPYGLVGK